MFLAGDLGAVKRTLRVGISMKRGHGREFGSNVIFNLSPHICISSWYKLDFDSLMHLFGRQVTPSHHAVQRQGVRVGDALRV